MRQWQTQTNNSWKCYDTQTDGTTWITTAKNKFYASSFSFFSLSFFFKNNKEKNSADRKPELAPKKRWFPEMQNAEGLQPQHPDGHGSIERRYVDGLASAERKNDAFVTRRWRRRRFLDGRCFYDAFLQRTHHVAMALRSQVQQLRQDVG